MAEISIRAGAKLHDIKCDSMNFNAIGRGDRTFVIVADDPSYASGDMLKITELRASRRKGALPDDLEEGETLFARVLLVDRWKVAAGHVAMSIRMHFPSIKERADLAKKA